MYISPNLIAVLGPLAYMHAYPTLCLTRHVPFKDMRRSIFQHPPLLLAILCYHRREVSATRVPSCFEALVSLFCSGMTRESLTSTSKQ